MAILKCKMCGGNLDIQDNTYVAECDFCGTRQTVPSADAVVDYIKKYYNYTWERRNWNEKNANAILR